MIETVKEVAARGSMSILNIINSLDDKVIVPVKTNFSFEKEGEYKVGGIVGRFHWLDLLFGRATCKWQVARGSCRAETAPMTENNKNGVSPHHHCHSSKVFIRCGDNKSFFSFMCGVQLASKAFVLNGLLSLKPVGTEQYPVASV